MESNDRMVVLLPGVRGRQFIRRMILFSSRLDKKESRIRRMFSATAPRYDLLNHLLSLNIDKYWRKKLVSFVPVRAGGPVLDLCTGTGDVALAYDRTYQGKITILAADFCTEMLEIANQKVKKAGASERVMIVEADAQAVPCADNYFEIAVVSFGLRNVTDPYRGLDEMIRVVRPGGRVAILEFSQPKHWFFGRMYRLYFRLLLPLIGQMISRNRDSAYRYLPASVLEFPSGEGFAAILKQRGLVDVWHIPFTFGIASLYVGRKPEVA